jgi:hypothetical protein
LEKLESFNNGQEKEIRALSVEIPKGSEMDQWLESSEMIDILANMGKDEFLFTGHACGNGYVTGYVNRDKKRLSESGMAFDSAKEAQQAFLKEITLAKSVIEDAEFVVRRGKKVKRAFLLSEYEGVEFFEIVWIEKGDSNYTEIIGPDRDVTVDFENYLMRQR